MAKKSTRPRVAIVGGNFAGLSAAVALGDDLDVTVVDAKPAFEWLPNIHEIVSNAKRGDTLRFPLRDRVRSVGHRFVRDRVMAVDAERGILELERVRPLPFDYCVVAIGGVNNTFDIPGADRHAMPFKSVEDCDAIRRRLNALQSGRAAFAVVVVGGGLEGIEALGELLRRFRDRSGVEIHLVEAADRLLAEGPSAVDAEIRRHVETMPVTLHTGERVAKVTPRTVLLASGARLRSDLTIWTGGARPSRLLYDSGLVESPGLWAPVDSALFSTAFANVLVAGDAAALSPPVAKQAYHAIDMGRCAAGNIARRVRGKPLEDFRASPKPMLLAFGDIDTFLVAGGRMVASPLLAAAKEAVFQVTIAGLDPLGDRRSIKRLKGRANQGLARLFSSRSDSWTDLARMFSIRIDGD